MIKKVYQNFVFDVMGLKLEEESSKAGKVLDKVMQFLLNMRNKAKSEKNFSLSDEIRNNLTDAGIQVKDSKEGSSWKI
jgi:cysteinyl-tRNA synthetase